MQDEIKAKHEATWDKWNSIKKHIENRSMSLAGSLWASLPCGGNGCSSAGPSFNLTETDLIMRVQEILCDLKKEELIKEKFYDAVTDMVYLTKDSNWYGQLIAMTRRDDQARYLVRRYKEFKRNQKANPKSFSMFPM